MPGFFDVLREPPVRYPLQGLMLDGMPVDDNESYPLFNRISIETIPYCNRRCSFCPVASHDRGHSHMTDQLYASIVDQLASIQPGGFDGVAQL